jgi:hypothetical protein
MTTAIEEQVDREKRAKGVGFEEKEDVNEVPG